MVELRHADLYRLQNLKGQKSREDRDFWLFL